MIKSLVPFQLILTLIFFTGNTLSASTIAGYPESGHWPYGPVATIETWSGTQDLLFYGEGTVLKIADADNPTDMQVLGEVRTEYMVYFIDILDNGQLAAVSDRSKWITFIDISDPTSPSVVGRYEVEDGRNPYGLAFGPAGSNKLYAAVGPAGLWVIDISDPTSPSLDGNYIDPGTDFVFDVEVLGDYAFLADDVQGVTAINISNPALPVFSAAFGAAAGASHITLDGSVAYVSRRSDGVHIIDLDVSGSPAVMTGLGVIPTTLAPRGFGTYYRAEISANGRAIITDGINQNGLLVFDIDDPSDPILLDNFDESMFSVDVIGNTAFVSRGSGIGESQVRAIDVDLTDPLDVPLGEPSALTVLDSLPAFSESFSATISGDLILVGNEDSGVVILDASDPTNVAARAVVAEGGAAKYATIVNQTLIVSSYSRRLQIYDISDLENPVLLPEYDLGAGASGYEVKAIAGTNRVLVGANSGGIQIIDFSDPSNPTEYAIWKPTGARSLHVAMEGTIVAAGGGNFLEVVDFSNPAAPFRIDGATLPQTILDVELQNSLVYTAAGINGVGIIQYLPNTKLETLGVFPSSPTSANGVKIVGDTAYIAADTFWGMLIADVSDPEDPQFVQNIGTPGNANKVDANGTMVVLADREGGVRVWGDSLPQFESDPLAGTILDFGDISVSATSTAENIAIDNLGGAELTLTCALTGTHSSQFNLLTCPTPVAAGGSTQVSVSCSPTSMGAKTASLDITTNDIDEGFVSYPLTCTGVTDEQQIVSPSPLTQDAAIGAPVSITAVYTTSDGDETLSGLGLRIHWDSSELNFVDLTSIWGPALNSADNTCQPDGSDFDSDPATDCYVNVSWNAPGNDFPGTGTTPTDLLTANFTSSISFPGASQINFSASSVALGYSLSATSATINSVEGNNSGPIFSDGFEAESQASD